MVKYNQSKTAYWTGICWYLIPRGKKRAPVFDRNETYILLGVRSYRAAGLMDRMTSDDREILLDAHGKGCLSHVWDEMITILANRGVKDSAELVARIKP